MNRNHKTPSLMAAMALSVMLAPTTVFADGNGDHHHGDHMKDSGHMMGGDHMMDENQMGEHMRDVMGTGRINKIWAEKHMINISHEPMPEMNWPKMRMNFVTDDTIKLEELNPGDEVTFTLQVDNDNNYLVKKIIKK